ncbi:MAG: glycosyltransferase [Planctomycetaceae bacterium]
MPTADERLRIAFVITDLDAGGAERALVQLATRLDRSRFEPHVYCLSGPGELVEVLRKDAIPVECLGAKRWWNVGAVWILSRQLARLRPAIVQTSLFHANIAGRLAAKAAGVRPVICGIRVAERRSRVPLWIDRATDWMVDRHVCVSRGVEQFSIERGKLRPEKLVVIPNGVDTDLYAAAAPADLAQFGIPNESETVLFVGRLDPQKAPEIVVEAARRLIPMNDRLHFLFVGEGPQRATLIAEIKRNGLEHRVHLAGRRSDVASIMKACTCLVLPSRWEGMPNVVLESMAAGLPVIATKVEGISELIAEGETGVLVSSPSGESLAEAITSLTRSPERMKAVAERAQTLMRERFAWDQVVSAHDDLYRRLLQN